MSHRNLRRVPLDFKALLDETWEGYLNPHPELEGTSKECRQEWQPIEPPVGEGYQLWSSTCDGPISPVFPSAEELADWAADNTTLIADKKVSADAWLGLFLEGETEAASSIVRMMPMPWAWR